MDFSRSLNAYIKNRDLYTPKPVQKKATQARQNTGFFSSFFGNEEVEEQPQRVAEPPRLPFIKKMNGLYVFGNPGTGKTFIMDEFYEQVPFEQKIRIHFNEFMLQTHDKLHKIDHVHSYFLLILENYPRAS